jgi:hypothetical protein
LRISTAADISLMKRVGLKLTFVSVVNKCGEQIETGVGGELWVRRSEPASTLRVLPNTEIDVDQHVLQGRGGGVLATISLRGCATESQQIRAAS